METVVSENSQIYYQGTFWNDFPRVQEYMCQNFTGDKTKWWSADFKERFCSQPFARGLVLNCGNGWVERALIDAKIVNQIIAFDYALDLLLEAERAKGDRPIYYLRADANRIDFGADQFDLVVNVAALHHVQYLNRLCLILCKALCPDGIFLNYDYIGPQRNQYSAQHWRYIRRANKQLPSHIRKTPMLYPHVPTMLYYDPTEAIHSDLIIETVARYFDIFERHDTGGGIAYEILTHNSKLKSLAPDELNPWIDKLLDWDREYTDARRVPSLFSYFLARPKKDTLRDLPMAQHFQGLENRREEWASRHRGMYSYNWYLRMLVHSIYVKFANSKIGIALMPHLKNWLSWFGLL